MSASPRPILVLLPGLDGTGIMFEPFLRVLDEVETRVVRYPVSLKSYPDCTAFAKAALPVNRPFVLVGESFSGPVAIALAAERPPGLVGLVLCCTFARNPRPALGWTAGILRALPPMRPPLPLLRRLLLGQWKPGPLSALVQTMLPKVPIATLMGRLLAVLRVDHTALLSQIQVRTMALCASKDRLVPKSATDWIWTHRSSLDLVTIQGPHWLLQTCPEACAQAIADFLQRTRNAQDASPGMTSDC